MQNNDGVNAFFFGGGMCLYGLAKELHEDEVRKKFLKYGRRKLHKLEDAEDFSSFAYEQYLSKGRKNCRWLLCDFLRQTIGRLDLINYETIKSIRKPILKDKDTGQPIEPDVYAKLMLLDKLTPKPKERKKRDKKPELPMPKPNLQISFDDDFYYDFGNIRLDFMARDIGINEKWIRLTETEWKIFLTLFVRQNLPVPRSGILKEVWQRESCHVSKRCVDSYIKSIRYKLNGNIDIQSIYGEGYKLCIHTLKIT